MKKETKIELTGFEMLEKQVNKSGNSGRVYVPVEWIGKRVKVILLEQ
jgi:putative transposon-encoded protein